MILHYHVAQRSSKPLIDQGEMPEVITESELVCRPLLFDFPIKVFSPVSEIGITELIEIRKFKDDFLQPVAADKAQDSPHYEIDLPLLIFCQRFFIRNHVDHDRGTGHYARDDTDRLDLASFFACIETAECLAGALLLFLTVLKYSCFGLGKPKH